MKRIAVLSDIHFAGPRERERTNHESGVIDNRLLRLVVRAYRHYVWLRDPFAHNGLLGAAIKRVASADHVVANGDYSCDSAFIGLADDPSFESAQESVGQLQASFRERLDLTIGDHELGKKSLFGGVGGLRLKSFERTVSGLGIPPVWVRRFGSYWLVGVTSSLWAFPIFSTDIQESEREAWESLRIQQIRQLEQVLEEMDSNQRWILFCHDPTALPYLARNRMVQSRLPQLERTILGHLHSELILWKSRLLAGMPSIGFLGNSIRRMSRALRAGKQWSCFRPTLCPSLAGLELMQDGGYLWLELDPEVDRPLRIQREFLPRGSL